MEETIVAISTPIGSGGISIIRLSGPQSIEIADKLFISKKGKLPSAFKPRVMTLGTITTSRFKELALVVVFKNPDSFTGEDLVEIQCHGGLKITEGVLDECMTLGARLAKNGEFSMRAFSNGKMSLSEAEGMIDMINAESVAELKSGYSLASGELSKLATSAQAELIDIMAEIEVSLDYPEHDIEYITIKKLKDRLSHLAEEVKKTLATCKTGAYIKSGIKALIVGKPNVGKSTLLNRLLLKDRAIVTPIPGTTRDIIEDVFYINDIKVNVIDTAGIHETEDVVEKIGIDRAKNMIKEADIVLFIVDSSDKFDEKDEKIYNLIANQKHIVVLNKSDLQHKSQAFQNSPTVSVSAEKNIGIDLLKEKMYNLVIDNKIIGSNIIITNKRHEEALTRALKAFQSAIADINSIPLDVIAINLKEAYAAFGEITGETSNEEIISAIFSKFCLGK